MKNIMYVLIIAIVLTLGVFWITENDNNRYVDQDSYTVGAALALSGDAAEWGEVEKNAIIMAVDEINKNGGIDGTSLEVKLEDTHSSSKDSITAVTKLVKMDGIDIIIGPTWLDTYPGSSKLVASGDKVLITPSAGISVIQKDFFKKNTFSTYYRPDVQASALGNEILKGKYDKVGYLLQNDAYYIDFAEHLTKRLVDGGFDKKKIFIEYINYGDDGKASILNLKKEGVNAVFYGLYDEQAIAVFRKQFPLVLSGVDLYANDLIDWHLYSDDYHDEYEGATYVTGAAMGSKFTKKFKERFQMEPLYSAATAYDTVYIIKDMIENRGISTYTEYLRSNSFETVAFGRISFDEIGGVKSSSKQYQIRKVVNGKSIIIE